jgi:hypothetical protein
MKIGESVKLGVLRISQNARPGMSLLQIMTELWQHSLPQAKVPVLHVGVLVLTPSSSVVGGRNLLCS